MLHSLCKKNMFSTLKARISLILPQAPQSTHWYQAALFPVRYFPMRDVCVRACACVCVAVENIHCILTKNGITDTCCFLSLGSSLAPG